MITCSGESVAFRCEGKAESTDYSCLKVFDLMRDNLNIFEHLGCFDSVV